MNYIIAFIYLLFERDSETFCKDRGDKGCELLLIETLGIRDTLTQDGGIEIKWNIRTTFNGAKLVAAECLTSIITQQLVDVHLENALTAPNESP